MARRERIWPHRGYASLDTRGMTQSALYVGEVRHARLRPVRHQLRYRVFMGLFDLDELATLRLPKWLFGHNCRALLSFYDRDYGDGGASPLRAQIEAHMRSAGITSDGGPIRVLCMPRLHGYLFAPITVFFCYARDGQLSAIVHDVHNTYGERHVYALPALEDASGRVEQACDKAFRVSPFLGMGLHYRFTTTPPDARVSVAIVASDAEAAVMTASFSGQRRPLTTGALVWAVLTHPMMTLGVWLAIHKEALLIWLKLKRARQPRLAGDPVGGEIRRYSRG